MRNIYQNFTSAYLIKLISIFKGYSEINSTKQCKLSMTHGRFSSRNFDDKARYTRRTRGIPVNGIPVSKGYSGGGIFSPPDHLLGICRWPAPTSGQEEYNSFEILPVFEFLHHIPEFAPKLSDSDDEERGFWTTADFTEFFIFCFTIRSNVFNIWVNSTNWFLK